MTPNTDLIVDQLCVAYADWEYTYSLQVKQAGRVALLGQSGIGKTTLLLALAGFAPIRSGRILFNTRDLTDLDPTKRPVTMLFQEDNLFEHLSVRENLRLGLEANATRESSLESAMQALGLKDQMDKSPHELSGGQRQRVAIIRTLLRPEPIVILDEPLTGLDRLSKQATLEWIDQQLLLKQKTLLMVTHQQDEADALSCTVVTL